MPNEKEQPKENATYSLKKVNFMGNNVLQLHENGEPKVCMNITPPIIPTQMGVLKLQLLPCVAECPHFRRMLIKKDETSDPILNFAMTCAKSIRPTPLQEKVEDGTKPKLNLNKPS